MPPLSQARTHFGLSLPMFARMTGISQEALARWEKQKPSSLKGDARRRVQRVAHILEGLARRMQRTLIRTWIERPNDACKELGTGTPLDLFERGDYEVLEDMAWYLESGTPS